MAFIVMKKEDINKYYNMAQSVLEKIGLGNILSILSVIFAAGLFYGKINTTTDEFKTLRVGDLARIEKIEISNELLKDKVHNLEKNNVQLSSDIKYIVSSIDEIKKLLQVKSIVK